MTTLAARPCPPVRLPSPPLPADALPPHHAAAAHHDGLQHAEPAARHLQPQKPARALPRRALSSRAATASALRRRCAAGWLPCLLPCLPPCPALTLPSALRRLLLQTWASRRRSWAWLPCIASATSCWAPWSGSASSAWAPATCRRGACALAVRCLWWAAGGCFPMPCPPQPPALPPSRTQPTAPPRRPFLPNWPPTPRCERCTWVSVKRETGPCPGWLMGGLLVGWSVGCTAHQSRLPPTHPTPTPTDTADDNGLASLPAGAYLDGLRVLGVDWRVLFK